jgi:phosphate transport system ATP-binding protein
MAVDLSITARTAPEAGGRPVPDGRTVPTVFRLSGLGVSYGSHRAVREVSMDIHEREITALIGPSGCGKSSVLRSLNRMNDLVPGAKVSGDLTYYGQDLYGPGVDPIEVRRRIGMVFQKPNPFPKSIYDNVAYGLRVEGRRGKEELDDRVEQALTGAALWDEVKDKLKESGLALSGRTAFFTADTDSEGERHGRLVEFDATERIFNRPADRRTEDYISGRFG